MFYALLIICLASDLTCAVENAVYADQSAPIFDTAEECHHAAIEHLHSIAPPQLKENTEYQIEVECERADAPA